MSAPSVPSGGVKDVANHSSHSRKLKQSAARLTFLEKLGVVPNVLTAMLTAVSSIFTSVLYGKDEKPPTLHRHVMYTFLRTLLASQSPRQMHYISISTDAAYYKVCKARGVEPKSITIEDGTKAHWIGSPDAQKILVNFHGGGYVLPASEFMVDFMFRLQRLLSEDGKDFAVLFLSYDVAPESPYPRQLTQAAMLVKHLTTTLFRSLNTIFLSGDSAGGNLALSLLSHISHPHPDPSVPRLNLSSNLAGVILISPWLDFDMSLPANVSPNKDLIGPVTGKAWSTAWLNSVWPHESNSDYYNHAQTAPASWWENVKIDEVLMVAGQDELLKVGIEKFVKRWRTEVKSLEGRVEWICAVGEAHDMPSLDLQFGYEEMGVQAKAIRSWLSARL